MIQIFKNKTWALKLTITIGLIIIIYLFRPRKSHQQVLLLHVAPTGENCEDCKEEEEMAPLDMEIVEIESLEKVHGEEP